MDNNFNGQQMRQPMNQQMGQPMNQQMGQQMQQPMGQPMQQPMYNQMYQKPKKKSKVVLIVVLSIIAVVSIIVAILAPGMLKKNELVGTWVSEQGYSITLKSNNNGSINMYGEKIKIEWDRKGDNLIISSKEYGEKLKWEIVSVSSKKLVVEYYGEREVFKKK